MTVRRAPSALSAFPAFTTKTPTTGTGTVTTFTAQVDGRTQPLMHQSLTVELTGPVNRTVSVITDYLGRASLPKDVPTGTYSTVVRYAGDATYAPTSRTGTLIVAPFGGYVSPVNSPPIVNVANTGSTVPIKFSLGGSRGMAIFAAGYPRVARTVCNPSDVLDAVEEYSSSSSGLHYDPATDLYNYNWKTTPTTPGCYRFDLRFVDGSTYSAFFRFT